MKKSKIVVEHSDADSCNCEACTRMTNEFGERLSGDAKMIATGLGYSTSMNLSMMMNDADGVTYTDVRAAVADGMLPCLHAIVNTMLAEAFFDDKPQPTRAELLLTLRRVLEPKLLYATDKAMEGDTMQRAERDGKVVTAGSPVRQ